MRNLEDFKRRLISKNSFAKSYFYSEEYELSRLVFRKRMELFLTQGDLANKANVSRKTISRIEGADSFVDSVSLSRVLHALDGGC